MQTKVETIIHLIAKQIGEELKEFKKSFSSLRLILRGCPKIRSLCVSKLLKTKDSKLGRV
jgi:hypothetical protein